MAQNPLDVVIPSLAGMATFLIVIGCFQCFVWKNLHVSAHCRVAGPCGYISFSAATVCSACTYILFERLLSGKSVFLTILQGTGAMWFSIFYFALCLLVFKKFGGHFKSLCPSHLLHGGAFAIESAWTNYTGANATKLRKQQVQEIGEKYGCHTCGKKKFGEFEYYEGHIPPMSLVHEYPTDEKKIFPHCINCCRSQAVAVGKYIEGKLNHREAVVTQAMSMKLYKLWFPFPALVQLGNMLFEIW